MLRQETDPSQAEFEEEDAGTGEGDEVMDEVEEQEDGYSTLFLIFFTAKSW